MNLWRHHGTKLLGALITLLGGASILTPDQLEAFFGASAPRAAVVIGGLLTLLRGFQNGGQIPGGPQARSPWLVSIAAAAVAGAVLLSGCKTLDQHQTSASLVVKYATLKVIEQAGTPAEQYARAARIRSIAADVEALVGGQSVTLEAVHAYVLAKLPPHLSPADQMLADALVQAVAAELQARIGSGLLQPEQVVQVRQVLGWVIEATAFATPAVET